MPMQNPRWYALAMYKYLDVLVSIAFFVLSGLSCNRAFKLETTVEVGPGGIQFNIDANANDVNPTSE